MDKLYSDLVISTESDVEQKLLFGLLINPRPIGLGYDQSDFRTKCDIRKIKIGKGQNSKLYFPDYVIILNGLPMLIIEAKAPGEDLSVAFRECRLYATEINASFTTGINPCSHLIVSNGGQAWAGVWDSECPFHQINISNFEVSNEKFHEFVKFTSKERLCQEADRLLHKLKGTAKFIKPVHLLGGKTTRNGSVGENSFGINLAIEYKYMFNPSTPDERKQIVKNAYVKSMKRESHVQPIDRIIRRAVSPAMDAVRTIGDTGHPIEILQTLTDSQKYAHEICLLIGSVGAGKSTFVYYLKEVALGIDIRDATKWIAINLNNAPISKELIYEWIIDGILETIRQFYPEIDFDSVQFLQSIFSTQIVKWSKGPVSIFAKDSEKYKDLLFEELSRLSKDKNKFLAAAIQYFFIGKKKMPIIVLDNCDKRDRDSQLLMFEVANWLKTQFYCMVFLPLREVTFDQYRHEPPLDTVISDLVFRIDAPLLERVIYERFKYALREIAVNQNTFYYFISNGMRIECMRKDVGSYLKAMLSSLFQNHFSKRLIVGLAGRNIRKGIEIFLDFCKSGYISEDDILRIRTNEGNFSLPPHIVSLIMLKGRRLFYEDQNSRIKNLFHCERDDLPPNPFIRISILRWLNDRVSIQGPSGVKGYHRTGDLIADMKAVGLIEVRTLNEINDLIAAECIISESQASKMTDLDELICISACGVVHLDLVRDISYLSIISEDTWFRNEEIAKRIASNLTSRGPFSSSSRQTAIENAIALVDYLQDYGQRFLPKPSNYLDDIPICTYSDYNELHRFVHELAMNDRGYIDYSELAKLYKSDMEIEAQVSSIQYYGIFVEFGLNGIGFIPVQRLSGGAISDYERGDLVRVKILGFNHEHKKFDVVLLRE